MKQEAAAQAARALHVTGTGTGRAIHMMQVRFGRLRGREIWNPTCREPTGAPVPCFLALSLSPVISPGCWIQKSYLLPDLLFFMIVRELYDSFSSFRFSIFLLLLMAFAGGKATASQQHGSTSSLQFWPNSSDLIPANILLLHKSQR